MCVCVSLETEPVDFVIGELSESLENSITLHDTEIGNCLSVCLSVFVSLCLVSNGQDSDILAHFTALRLANVFLQL